MFSSGMTYQRARSLLLLVGLIIVGLVTLTMLWRGVDPVEISATLFFAPLFVAALYLGVWGGLVFGAAAAVAYVLLRMPAIDLVGFSTLSGLIMSRVAGYLLFGGIGGWAISVLRNSIEKLELYDAVDDETGLGNARSVVEVLDTERSRAERYSKVFSVVTATFSLHDSPRRQKTVLSSIGTQLAASVRDSDHVAHGREGSRHWVALVLPETGAVGAQTVAGNLVDKLGASVGGEVDATTATYPDDPDGIGRLLDHFRELDSAARP